MVMAGMMGTVAQGRGAEPVNERRIIVCMESAPGPGPALARITAARVFADIDVKVTWLSDFRGCPAEGLKISLNEATPGTLRPGELAYALPYEGTHIEVFYDRILRMVGQRSAPLIMANVMVHEITHILERVARHSEQGLMKARWSNEDFRSMEHKPLEFAREDVELIYAGLTYRAAHHVAEK